MNNKPIIIIGTGLAGYNLAREFRKINKDTPLQLFTVDQGRFYSKPTLSNALTNGKSATQLAMADANKMKEQLNAAIFTETEVNAIDTKQRHIVVGSQCYPYSKLVFACGASQIQPTIQGNAISEVSSINNLVQYAQFRERIEPKQHIAIIGAGFIGCEFANDLNNVGFKVSVIATSPYPLDRLIPESAGKALQIALANEGVEWYFEKIVTNINKNSQSGYQIKLNDGNTIAADNILLSIGLRANTQLAEAAGISINRGIVTDKFLETSAENVYALGDCAEIEGKLRQFVAPITYCAKALAQTLAGNKTEIKFPHMPIIVKTPTCPILIVDPEQTRNGSWHIEESGLNTKAIFYNPEKQLEGFVLTGKETIRTARQELLAQLPLAA